MIVGVTHDDAPIAVDGNAIGIRYADAANVSPVPVPQHLHTIIETISYNKVTRAIKRNAMGTTELAVTCTFTADCAQLHTLRVPQHLDTMVEAVTHNKVALIIKSNTAFSTELPVAAARAAYAVNEHAIAQPKHLNAPICVVVMSNIVGGVPGHTKGILWMPTADSHAP